MQCRVPKPSSSIAILGTGRDRVGFQEQPCLGRRRVDLFGGCDDCLEYHLRDHAEVLDDAQQEWVTCIKTLLPKSEQFSSPRMVLAEMTGMSCSEVTLLPLRLQALPSSIQGKTAVKGLQEHCECLVPIIEQCLRVATRKGLLDELVSIDAGSEPGVRAVACVVGEGFQPLKAVSTKIG